MSSTRNLLVLSGAALGVLASATSAQNRQLELEWLRNAGARYEGVAGGDFAGRTVGSAGDVNDDGFDDFLIGAWPEGLVSASGKAYVIFGGSHPITSDHVVGLGSADVTINGFGLGSETGRSLSAAGDVNNDGIDDFLVGVPRQDPTGPDSGAAYLIYGSATLPATINLSALAPGQATVFHGVDGSDQAGTDVAGVGDVNGDGIDDILIGARGASPNGVNLCGQSYIVYGSASLGDTVLLGGLDASTGVKINGIAASDQSGVSVAAAGFFNGDAFRDVIIGSEQANPGGKNNAGQGYVVFGGSSLPASIDLASLGSAGMAINGEVAGDRAGGTVSGGADVNGDGFDDVVLGADEYDVGGGTSNEGRAYIVFGSASPPSTRELNALGANGIVLSGADPQDCAGIDVAMGGDMNGDGLGDVLIGAFNADPNGLSAAGEAYLLHGATGLPNSFTLDALDQYGVQYNGTDIQDRAGESLAFLGDFTGDGFDDFAIGARFDDPNGADSGSAYLVRGSCYELRAEGPAAENVTHTMKVHGLPGASFLLWISFAANNPAVATGKGPFWVSGAIEVLVFPFAANGELAFDLTLPTGSIGVPIFWQHIVTPQGQGCDLGQLLAYVVQ